VWSRAGILFLLALDYLLPDVAFACPKRRPFAAALAVLVTDQQRAPRMGRAGREHVAGKFSKAAFGAQREQIVEETVGNSRSFGLE
jgi:hypothetical protein